MDNKFLYFWDKSTVTQIDIEKQGKDNGPLVLKRKLKVEMSCCNHHHASKANMGSKIQQVIPCSNPKMIAIVIKVGDGDRLKRILIWDAVYNKEF